MKILSPYAATTYDYEIIYFPQNVDLPVNPPSFMRLYG